jgi:hypothetical protein
MRFGEEEVEVFLGPEAGVEEGPLFVRGQSRGEDRVVSVATEVFDDFDYRCGVEETAPQGDDLSLGAVAAAWPESESDTGGSGEHPGSLGRPGDVRK